MNIINYSMDTEQIGALKAGTSAHRKFRSSLTSINLDNSNKIEHKKVSVCSAKTLFNDNHFTSKIPGILKEYEFDLAQTNLNKIFTAQWLDDRRVIMGTKCNKILVLDTVTGRHSIQSPLKSHPNSKNISSHCGIHSISINPSGTLLATGAEHVNDIAIYNLPSLEPVSVGYNAHSYWIFDIVWLDDQHVVSGAGDNRLALWNIDSSSMPPQYSSFITSKNTSISSTPNRSTTSSCSSTPSYKFSKLFRRSYLNKSNTISLTSDRRNLKRQSPSNYRYLSNYSITSGLTHSCSFFHPFYVNSSFSTSSLGSSNNYFRHRFNFGLTGSSSQYVGHQNSLNSHNLFYNFVSTNRALNARKRRRQSLSSNVNLLNNFNNLENEIFNDTENNNNQVDDDDNDDDENTEDDDEDDDDDDDDVNEEDEEEENENLEENDDSQFNYYYDNAYDDEDDGEEDSDTNNNDDTNENILNDQLNEFNDANYISRTDDLFNDDDELSESDDGTDFLDLNNHENVMNSNELRKRRLNSSGRFRLSNEIKYKMPAKVIKCKQSKRIRALAFNPKRNEIAAISMNAAFHYFDVRRFEQKYTKKLSPLKENVCLTINNDYSIYAVGSASHVQLLDANNARPLTEPVFIKKDIGVRSLHFRNSVLSIGTGVGTVLFYDLRAKKFLHTDTESNYLKLQTTGGWILRNGAYNEDLPYMLNSDNTHAIYSHSYDPTGTKMLTVGGPLTVNLYGHYAGVWI